MKSSFLSILFTFCIFNVILFYSCGNKVTDGLIVHYQFTADSTLIKKNGFEIHEVTLDTSIIDAAFLGDKKNAYTFDGIDDYIQIPNNPKINFSNEEKFTISFWIKVPTQQNDTNGSINDIISKWSTSTAEGFPFGIRIFNQTDQRNGKVYLSQFGNSRCILQPTVISETTINDNQWHHIVAYKDDLQKIYLFIDGELEGTADATLPPPCLTANEAPILIGLRKKSGRAKRAFTGSISDLKFYNRALRKDEIEVNNNVN